MSDTTYQVEYSKTDRASCKDTKCKGKIGKGVLRIGKESPSPFGDDTMLNWYHASCAFRALTRARSTTKKIDEMDDLVGHESIGSSDKKYLAKLIAGEKLWDESGWTEPSSKSSTTEKKTAKKRKASPSPPPKKKAKTAKTYLEAFGTKFWEISVTGDDLTVHYGKIGCAGATNTKSWGTHAAAVAQMERQIRAKKRAGYKEEGEGSDEEEEEEEEESEEESESEEEESEEEEEDDWQWQDEDKKWHSYSTAQHKGIKAAIRAKKIFYKFDVGSNSYRLHLKKLYQINTATSVQRKVRVK